MQNVGTVAMQNLVIIDILPFVGDTGVRDTNPRGSQWSPLLVAPIIPPSGTTLYYSTSGNPCRGEVGGPTTSCDPPNWTTVAPSPISSVRSFKLEFGSRVVNPFDFVSFEFVTTTPGNVGAGLTAYNSFAYQADRGDGLGSLAAEPQKVGIALGACDAARLGDYVWVDTNNDGIQNDGPTGLNGVFVRLFSPGVDGVAGTFDDVPLASTITGPSPTNQPGWYSFPGLAPGTYFVQITPPPSYAISPRDTTAEANDSDSFPNGMAAPVMLGVNEDNPNIDFGLFPTAFGAAGNVVWFDRNNDGIQNEPWTEGANGVTVHLYLDDGDGNPEPGGDDPLSATMVTATDVYSRPGYYLFDGLSPGLPYFIQFVTPASATSLTTQNAGGDDTADSDANPSDGTTPTFSVAALELNPTFDAGLIAPSGPLSLGDQLWLDTDNDGVFEPENGEIGIDDVRLDLYVDNNSDLQPTLDEFTGSTTTATNSGFAGKYLFDDLAAGNYIVIVAPQNFGGGGALSGKSTSTGNDPAPDPDDDANGDDNGTDVGALIASRPVTLSDNGEPTSEDGNSDSNLTVDFGFINTVTPPPVYDYGDAPDVGAGSSTANYNTTALDNGPYHLLGVAGAPFLGPCVDDDNGFLQNINATNDDTTPGATVTGTCVGGDDENGVAFTGSVTPGASTTFSVTSGGPSACSLDAWVDWNQNGVFGDAGEQIATSLNIPTGSPTVLTPSVPARAIPGTTYARFRCSTAGGLTPTGAAPNGEVEDYKVTVIGHDFPDAPSSYGSADHIIDPLAPLLLGSCADTEGAAQSNAGANGDDGAPGTSRIGSCFDDEDGVIFNTLPATCTTASVTVNATGAGLLDGWLDFNADGDFNDPGEQVFINQALTAGANALNIVIPCSAIPGNTYSRFRLSTSGGLTPTGTAADGEVEDYVVSTAGTDFGDDPNSYSTTFGSNGARHPIVTGFSLGATVDSETDGQPNIGAIGDGADEDGLTMPAILVACSSVNIPVTLTNTAAVATPLLDAWIDFAGDGVFNDPTDRIATSFALSAGANNLSVNVPCNALSSASYARFRLTSTGIGSPVGAATDGEVEDYAVTIEGLDFGDAPDPTFPTMLASNGARHAVLPSNNPTLGAIVDTEADGAMDLNANGDDGTGSDDEDGVTLPGTFIAGMPATVHVTTGSTGGNVNLWIDFTGDGDWNDLNEHVLTDQALAANASQDFVFSVPVGSFPGNVYVRARISSQTGVGVTGLASDGEIEDYVLRLTAEDAEIGTSMRIVSVTPNGPCGVYDVLFEVGLANAGNVTLSNVQATTVLNTVFVAPATYSVTSVTSATLPEDVTFNGASNTNLLLPGATLQPGESGTIQFVVHLDATCNKVEYEFTTTGTGVSPAGNPVSDPSQDGDDTDPDDDGDTSDNNDPTILALDPQQIPTLDEWALIAVTLLLAAVALKQMR